MRRWRNSHRSNHAAGRLFSAVAQCAVAGRQRPGGNPAPRGAVQPALSQPGATDRLLHRHDAERPAAVARTHGRRRHHSAAGRRRFAALFRRGRGRAGTSLAGDAAARSAAAAHHPGVHLLRRAAGGAGRAARRLSVHHPPRRYRAYPPAGAGGAGEREPYLRRRSRRLHQRGHHHRHRFGAARSIATAAPAGRATSPAIWWSISAAPGTIRSCRHGCATATTCTRRCTARRT